MIACPLCKSKRHEQYCKDKNREYLQCLTCGLVFVPPEFYLRIEDEKAEYDLHTNSPDDIGYRRFLSRLFDPIVERLKPGAKGLDFGSGPGPTLSVMFEEAGFSMSIYDVFYADHKNVFEEKFDFITTSETVEHLHQPFEELQRLWGCLKPGGMLGIMTKLVKNGDAFKGWHYKNDMTHVCFFSRDTFQWLAEELQADVEFIGNDVILFTKS